MKLSKTIFIYLSCVIVIVSIACLSNQTNREFAAARARLLETSIKADSAGLVQARQRFETLLQNEHVARNDSLAAWAHYYLAFANWQLSFVTFGNRRAETITLNEEALSHLAEAVKLRENFPEAYAVMRRCQFWLAILDRSRSRTIWAESAAALKKAQTLAPEHPAVMLEEAITLFYNPPQAGGDQQKGLERFRAALQRFAAQSPRDAAHLDAAHENFWRATTHMMLGQAHLGTGEVEAAERDFQAALQFEPDYAYVKNSMLPMTQFVPALAMRDLTKVAWSLLANDSESDGANPNWAAVKNLSYFYDAATDTVWFKLDLSRLPNPNAFGINLVVDTDEDQSNGASWWGGNRAFKYDRLVTVWVVKSGEEAYRGAVGVGDFRGVTEGRYTNLFQNNLAFRADSARMTMVLGVKKEELDADGRMNLIAAVGSNAGWNDDVPDSSSARLILK